MKERISKWYHKRRQINDEVIQNMTKKWVNRIMTISCIWITLSYVLAFMGKESIAENLSAKIVMIILGTFIPYLCKSFFETFCEKHNELKEKELTSSLNIETPEDEGFFEEVHKEIDDEDYESSSDDENYAD